MKKRILSILTAFSLILSMFAYNMVTVKSEGSDFSTFYNFEDSMQGLPAQTAQTVFTHETTEPLHGAGSLRMSISALDQYTLGGSTYPAIPDATGYDGICFRLKSDLPADSFFGFWMRATEPDTTYKDMYLGHFSTMTDINGNVLLENSFNEAWGDIIMPVGEFDGYVFLPFNGAKEYTDPYSLNNLLINFYAFQVVAETWNSSETIFDNFSYYKGSDYAALTADMNLSILCDVVSSQTPENAIIGTDTITADVTDFLTTIDVTTSEGASWSLFSDAACTIEIANKTMRLADGENTAYIKVTAEDGTTNKVYTLVLNRASTGIGTFYDFEDSMQGLPAQTAQTVFTHETTEPLHGAGSLRMSISALDQYTLGGSTYPAIPDATGYDGICFRLKSDLPADSFFGFWMRATEPDTTYKDMYLGHLSTMTDVNGNVLLENSFNEAWGDILMPVGEFDGYIFLPFNGAKEYTDPYSLNNLMINFYAFQVVAETWNSSETIFDNFSYYKGSDYAALTATMNISFLCNIDSSTIPADAIIGTDTISANVPYATTAITVDITPSAGATWKLFSDAACTTEITDKTIDLAVGENTAYIKVTAEDTTTTKIYTLSVTRALEGASSECDVVSVTTPAGATIGTDTITASLLAKTVTVDITPSDNASWKLFSDSDCTVEITDKVMALALGDNTAYIKVIAEDTITFKIYTITVTRVPSTECDIVSSQVPLDAVIGTDTIAGADTALTSITVNVTASPDATWKLFSDAACTVEITDNIWALAVGDNTAYIKVTAEDGTTSKIYTLTIERTAGSVNTFFDFEADNNGITLYDDPARFPAGELVFSHETTSPLIGDGSLNISGYMDFNQTYSVSNFFDIPDAIGYDGICFRIRTNAINNLIKYTMNIGTDSYVLGKAIYMFDVNGVQVGDGVGNVPWGMNNMPEENFDGYIFLPFSGSFTTINPANLTDLTFNFALIDQALYGFWNGTTTIFDNMSFFKGTDYTSLISGIDPEATPLDIIYSTVPANAKIGVDTVTASVPSATMSITVDVTTKADTSWKLFSDAACENEITDKVMPLPGATNEAYIKVTSGDGETSKIYTVTITKTGPTVNDIISVESPAGATIGVDTVTADVEGSVKSVTIAVTPSEGATWKLFSDFAGTTEITDKVVQLAIGENKVYIIVTAEGGASTKKYTVTINRAEPYKPPHDDTPLIDEPTGIDVTDFSGSALPANCFLKVVKMDSTPSILEAIKIFGNNATLLSMFNLTVVDQYDEVMPTLGLVVFRFPLPAGIDADKIAVCLINSDGSAKELVSYVVGNQIEVYSLNFGNIALVELGDTGNPQTTDSIPFNKILLLIIAVLTVVSFSIAYKNRKSLKKLWF